MIYDCGVMLEHRAMAKRGVIEATNQNRSGNDIPDCGSLHIVDLITSCGLEIVLSCSLKGDGGRKRQGSPGSSQFVYFLRYAFVDLFRAQQRGGVTGSPRRSAEDQARRRVLPITLPFPSSILMRREISEMPQGDWSLPIPVDLDFLVESFRVTMDA